MRPHLLRLLDGARTQLFSTPSTTSPISQPRHTSRMQLRVGLRSCSQSSWLRWAAPESNVRFLVSAPAPCLNPATLLTSATMTLPTCKSVWCPVCPYLQLPLPCGSGELSAASDASPLPVIWADLAPNDGTSLAATADYLTSDQVTWFADFGCAVLATGALGHGGDAGEVQAARGQDLRPRPDHVSLHVVAPECWRFEAHRYGLLTHVQASYTRAAVGC